MSLRTLSLATLVAALAAAPTGPAWAQQPPSGGQAQDPNVERARLLHEEGLRHYAAGQYGRAISAYRKAYALVPAPGILFNLAQAYRLRGDCRRAYRAYRNFLRVAPSSAEAALAREHSRGLRACAQKAELARDPNAVDDATPEPAPAPTPAVPAPTPQVTAPPVEPAPAPPEAAPAPAPVDAGPAVPPQDGQNKKLLGLGIGAAGVVLSVVGVYYGVKAHGEASDLDDFFADGGAWTPALAEQEDALGRHRTLSLGFGLVGAAAVGTGAVLYWLGHRESRVLTGADQGPVAVAPQADGAMVVWRGAF
jgi:tetratricopeptide (TPR) repeat protein